jgi:tetratricopeptide (TPR) repeat protein
LDSDKTILICGKISELNEIITDLKNTKGPFKAGVLTEELWNQFKVEEATPLVFLIGALEHAKRLKDEHIIFFNGFTYHVIGDLYYEWNNLDKALKYYLLAQKHTQQPVELALSIAAVYYALGELEKAEKVLKKELCACRGEDPAIHYNLGLIYIKKEKLEDAKFHLYKAYLLQPENQIFREALVKCLWDMEAYEELEEILNSIKNPSEKEEIFLGKLYFQKKDYQRAFEYLKKIFKLPDRDGETLLFLAWLYLYFNKEKEVIDILLKEAQNILSEEEFNKIIEKLGLELR